MRAVHEALEVCERLKAPSFRAAAVQPDGPRVTTRPLARDHAAVELFRAAFGKHFQFVERTDRSKNFHPSPSLARAVARSQVMGNRGWKTIRFTWPPSAWSNNCRSIA